MKIKERKDIPQEYKWRLEDIFPDNEAWEECFFALSERMGKIASYKGRLADEDALFSRTTLANSISTRACAATRTPASPSIRA